MTKQEYDRQKKQKEQRYSRSYYEEKRRDQQRNEEAMHASLNALNVTMMASMMNM